MKESVGFIGLGAMGKPMAMNVAKAGYPLIVYDLDPKRVSALEAEGARVAQDIKQVAAASKIVITVLPADDEIMAVFQAGLVDCLRPGAVWIEMTSALPQTVIKVGQAAREQGKDVLDAPVSGGVAKAADGSLTIMAGGTQETFERCKPLLEVMGKTIFYTGDLGNGKAVKMINQLMNAGNTMVASEAVFLAQRMGIDLDLMIDVINRSSGASWVFTNNVPKSILAENFNPGFRLDLMKKDINLSLDYARQEKIVLPVMSFIAQIYQAMMNQGYADRYYTVVSQWIKQQNSEEQ